MDPRYLENFPQTTIAYLQELADNNNREWFEAHRFEYEEQFLKPAQAFIVALADNIKDINPNLNAIPKIDKSIFRIYRDVRFSKDKRPYKTNLGMYLWEGSAKKMECSGLYIHVDFEMVFVAAGMHAFTKEQLKQYRELISREKAAEKLQAVLDKLTEKGYSIGGRTYKKVPSGFDKEYRYTDLLLHSGVYASYETQPGLIKADQFVRFARDKFSDLAELHQWMVNNMYR